MGMRYPIIEIPLIGGGMVIAIIAIIHVLIAHFAVGAGIFNAVAETIARRRDDTWLLEFIKRFSRFLILFAFVLGAVTGVGIWFSISVVSPRATSALIHQFVWAWGIEWVLFLVEIISGYVYYYSWDRLSPRRHMAVGWIYAISAWMSLFVINGILTFMLSPGEWLETGSFWAAFFNPTFWPSLVLRTISALSLAGIFVAIVVNLAQDYTREQRTHIINFGAWFLSPMALMAPVSIWYFWGVPAPARDLALGGAAAVLLFLMFGLVTSTVVAFYAYFGLIRRRRYINLETAVTLGLLALIATGSMEFVREGIRKPYVIYGYLYSNGIRPDEMEALNRDGILPSTPWAQAGISDDEPRGRAVFRAQCVQCHTINGFNGIAPLVKGWSRELLETNIARLHELKYFMPPFAGKPDERDALIGYLQSLNSDTPTREARKSEQ